MNTLKLSADLDRRLSPYDITATRYLRIQVTAPDRAGTATRPPLNLALVIDRSGSMSGQKLERAKEAAIFCLQNLTGADRAAVVAYDDNVTVIAPSRALTPQEKNRIISQVRTITPGGSTNLSGGWLAGAQEVSNYQREANYVSRAILLSDGLANVGITDPERLAHHAGELRHRGVSTTTVGVGNDFDHRLMEAMSVKGGGHFYYIEHSQQIPDVLLGEIGEVLSTCARQVYLEVDLPHGVRGELMNNFETTRDGKRLTVRLDDMIAGEVRTVMFKLEVRPGEQGVSLPIEVNLAYVDVDSGDKMTVSSREAALQYAAAGENHREAPNESVLADAAALEAAIARDEALRLDEQGLHDQSAARLKLASKVVMSIAPSAPIAARESMALDAEGDRASEGLTAQERKSMHFNQNLRRRSRGERP